MRRRAALKMTSAPVRRLRLALTVATALLALTSIVCSVYALKFQRELGGASRYNRTFDFSQAGVELMRMQLALHEATEGGRNTVPLRYGILKNRADILSSVAGAPDGAEHEMTADIAAAVREIEPLVGESLTRASADAAIRRLSALVSPVLRLASAAHAKAGDQVQANQHALSTVFWGGFAVTFLLTVVGASLIVLVGRQNRSLAEIGRTDGLTGLSNRFAFNLHLEADKGLRETVMILVDVDHFKALNDTLGHNAGDRVLLVLAERLRQAAPAADIIARIGGDEFAIVFSGNLARMRAGACCAS